MSQIVVFSCDGPSCLENVDENIDESALVEAGWLMVSFYDESDEVVRESHFHSFACLSEWATEGANA